jgi:murein DD-endopeptidase MepM/ murein hydrolase activator NlpD
MHYTAMLIALLLSACPPGPSLYLPIQATNRQSVESIKLTAIGKFGLPRKERKEVPTHLHTGIDIARPGTNYTNEPIFAITTGTVMSTRTDGQYAEIIIAHELNGLKFWTAYEHIAGIVVKPGDIVNPKTPIARFMNKSELDKFGWQFDHFHFEVLKHPPQKAAPDTKHPTRFFNSYTLICKTDKDLAKYFYEPIAFLKKEMLVEKLKRD